MLKRLALDRVTWLCSLLCTATFLFWMHDAAAGIHLGAVLFFLAMTLVFFCLGDALLRWLRVPAGSSHPFPLAMLSGSAVAALLLFILHLCLPFSLRTIDLLLAVASVAAYAFAPARDALEPKAGTAWKTVAAIAVSLLAASLWTQDLRPGLVHQGNQYIIHVFNDTIFFAEFSTEQHDDVSALKLGDPALSGRPLPVYHYASYLLSASAEVWLKDITAFETILTLWIPLGFFLVGLAAFCLAADWLGDLAGLAAILAVLLVPSTPLYGVPIEWYSFHRIIAISTGLAYGIAGASAALVLLSAGLRSNRKLLLAAGFILMTATVALKAHITLAAFPLAVAWVLCAMPGWTLRKRVVISVGVALAGYVTLRLQDHLKVGPNILPNGQGGGLKYVSDFVDAIGPGFWHHLIFHRFFYNRFFHPLGVTFVMFAGVLGIWLVLGLGILLSDWRNKRTWKHHDLLPILATAIFLFYAFVPPPNQRGTVDEVWLRPFFWFYFLIAVWCAARIADWLERRWNNRPAMPAAIVLVAIAGLLIVPLMGGKTVQHAPPYIRGLTDMPIDAGFIDCALYVRSHSPETDIVQSQPTSVYPVLTAFAERRAYLGQTPLYWEFIYHGTPVMAESERRNDELGRMRRAHTKEELLAFAKETGIRWYIAKPQEDLSWPQDVTGDPAFTSEGYRVYDLQKVR